MQRTIDIIIIQKPNFVKYDCPHCDEEIETKYEDFTDMLGDYCDWTCGVISCPECGGKSAIRDIEWD